MIAPTHALAHYSSPEEWKKIQVPLEERSSDYIRIDSRIKKYTSDPERAAKHKKAIYNFEVCRNILSLGDFLYFGGGPTSPILYFNSPSPLLSSAPIFERLSTPTLRRLVNACAPDLLEPQRVDDIIKTFLDIPDPNQQISRRIIAISENLYWDRGTASLVSDPAPYRCFFRLFDTRESEKNVPAFPASTFDATFSDNVQAAYKSLLSALNALPNQEFPKDPTPETHPTLPYSFPFILDWADGSYSLYWDLLKILATTFFNKRPDAAYILTGTGANGKSACAYSTKVIIRRGDQVVKATQGSLRKGDYVLTPKGEWAKVIDPMVNPTSTDPCYEVTLQDGRSVVATYDHIWTVVSENHLTGHRPRIRDEYGRPTEKRRHIPLTGYDPEMWETRRTDELLADLSSPKPKLWYLPPTAPAPFPERDLPIDPYDLGIILGDGCLQRGGKKRDRVVVTITGMDDELVGRIGVSHVDFQKTALSPTGTTCYRASSTRFSDGLISLGLTPPCRSYEKFIPPEYLISSIEQRKALLAGLLDSDGSINPLINQLEFSTSSKQLVEDVKELVFSLGGTATETSRDAHYTQNGERHKARRNYRLSIRMPFNPFRLSRKASLWKKPKRLGYVRIKSIASVPSVPCNCISVKDPEGSPENQHTYLAGNYVPTHNCFVGLAHTIFGTANTSRAPLSEIGDHHITNSLRFSILNAPDDEGGNKKKDDINSYTKVFKQLASHETLTLPVLYSQTPIDLKADFMCIFPMNMFPRWSGSDVSALARRTVLVPFTHDFRDCPVHYDNFAKETYTTEVLASLVGQLLAIATFYKEKPLTYSSVIDNMAKQVELENDTPRAYLKLFEKYFNGFQSKKMLYCDYVNWVKANEAGNIVPLADFRLYWEKYLNIPKDKRPKLRFQGADGQIKRPLVYRIPTPLPHFVLANEVPLKDLGITETSLYGVTIQNAIENEFSVVDILDKMVEEH